MIFNNKVIFLFIILVLLVMGNCYDLNLKSEKQEYLNLNDSVQYVGMEECRKCHGNIYETYIKTGMGQSFGYASKRKSAAKTVNSLPVYDPFSDFHYFPFWDKDSFKIIEYRHSNNDTTYKRTEVVDYIIGSGQHTNSHLYSINDYLYQMPLTFYTQKTIWDLPPGFENGYNSRFSREIGIECISCHNAYPDFVEGSVNKYNSIPNGIDCERCHGPGSVHVKQKQSGIMIDTSIYIDYSIVNPAKLDANLQFDLCQRCHLQGNTVLKENKSFFDFKPGMKLSEVMYVFLPKYEGNDNDFIMASHADRLKMSKCFKESLMQKKNEKSLKPYKNALTCVSCHNPHESVKTKDNNYFNNSCLKCHQKESCSADKKTLLYADFNCIKCHMQKNNTLDIPHVTTTDHYIRIYPENTNTKTKSFTKLSCINDTNPSNSIMAEAYLNQFEKFSANTYLLDSAESYLSKKESKKNNLALWVRLYYLRNTPQHTVQLTEDLGHNYILDSLLTTKSQENKDAWTCYRISEAFSQIDSKISLIYIGRAVKLSPYVTDFKVKYGNTLLKTGKYKAAIIEYESLLNEYPKQVSGLTNLGYAYLLDKQPIKSLDCYNKALQLDPDYEPALMNKAGWYFYHQEFDKGKAILILILSLNPANEQAKTLLLSINAEAY